MGFLGGTEHDVFISYAHLDNETRHKDEEGWVTQFHEELKLSLAQRIGSYDVRVWRDEEIGAAQKFNKTIEKAVCSSAVMVSLLSPRYLRSPYCNQELRSFAEKAEAEPETLVIDDRSRILPVMLRNIPPDKRPEVCQGVRAFTFHDSESADLGDPLHPRSDAFGEVMKQLVREVHLVLEEMKGLQEERQPLVRAAQPDVFRVFISEVADDLGPAQRQLTRALEREGISTITSIPPPHEVDEHATAVAEAVTAADLCVHLLGRQPGEPADDQDIGMTYPLLQAQIGRERAHSQLILHPAELDLTLLDDSPYAEFLRSLKTAERKAARLEVVRTARQQMLDEVLRKRDKILDARRVELSKASGVTTAFIDSHTRDLSSAGDLLNYLDDCHIRSVLIPSSKRESELSLFADHIRSAKLFIVLFGGVARDWVLYRLREAHKLIVENDWPTKIGVYIAPPIKPAGTLNFPYPVAMNSEHFDPDTLAPLLQTAGAGS